MTMEKESTIGNMQIVEIKDNDDGSSTVTFDMSPELLNFFATIGIRKAIMDFVDNTLQDEAEHEHS